jgi:hypothetical protein
VRGGGVISDSRLGASLAFPSVARRSMALGLFVEAAKEHALRDVA